MSTTPVPSESTAGVELASTTEGVAAAKVEALGPQVEGEARHVCGYCHANESVGLVRCEGARAKSTCCGEGISTKEIWWLERAPLLYILMRICLAGRRLGRKFRTENAC